MNDAIAVLDGGSHDGESTTVSAGVTRLVTPSEAPGLVDVYEQTEELRQLPGNDSPAVVFRFAGQQPAAERVPADDLPEPPQA